MVEAKWNDGETVATFDIGPEPSPCIIDGLMLEPGASGELSLWSTREAYPQEVTLLGEQYQLPAMALLREFRVDVD